MHVSLLKNLKRINLTKLLKLIKQLFFINLKIQIEDVYE